MNYKDFFKDKKIAVIGMGPHGEMVADIKFLLRNKAVVSLYDIRSEERLKNFISNLPVGGLAKMSFGQIASSSLLEVELILLSPEISKKSNFLKETNLAGIQIEFPETLFFKLAPAPTFIGVTGLYGKSSVTHQIYAVLKTIFDDFEDQGLFLIDSDSSSGTLAHLKKIKKGDVVLSRIPENLIQYYHEMRISPHVAVITSTVSFKILEFQTHNNFIVASDEVVDAIKLQENFKEIRAKILRTRAGLIPSDWDLKLTLPHQKENAALTLQTSQLFKIPMDIARDVLGSFSGLKGRLEMIKRVSGIEFYNDAASISPKSTLSALRSLSSKVSGKNITLILGGAYTGHDYNELINNLSQYVSNLILLPGSGTIGLRKNLESFPEIKYLQVSSLEEAVRKSKEVAKKGDLVLFSPAFEAVGVDVSRKERGERFVRAVRDL